MSPPEADEERRKALDDFIGAVAKICGKSLHRKIMNLHGWYVVFGDGTDLEVDGNCFDAACMGRNGQKIMRLMTVMLGPITVGYDLLPGNRDEGVNLPGTIRKSRDTVREIVGKNKKVLALLDAAFFEMNVINEIESAAWSFIVCANQQRNILERLVKEQPDWVWSDTGMDASRGWRRSQVCVFVHTPSGWDRQVTIICRRWESEGEIEGLWNYSFLATRIEPEEIPKKLSKKYGYAQTIWMLYGTKQGRENHYKTPLRDIGLHHPPSCRLGVNQAFYAIALAASTVAMVLRYRVMPGKEKGMHLWRIRMLLFQISGYIKMGARTLTVYLSGGDMSLWLQALWKKAFAEAGRL